MWRQPTTPGKKHSRASAPSTPRSELSPEDLEALSDVAFWASHVSEAIDARQRACDGVRARGTCRRSGSSRARRLAAAFRPRRHLGGIRLVRSSASAYSPTFPSTQPTRCSRGSRASSWAASRSTNKRWTRLERSKPSPRRVGDRDLVAMGLSMQGQLRVLRGDVAAGMALMDEALTGAFAGELGQFASAEIFCEMVVSCIDAADFQRAAEWLDTAERAGQHLVCFPGCCRVHRSTVLRHRGQWPEAQAQARQARAEVAGVEVLHEGMALTELGELHRCKGEVDACRAGVQRGVREGVAPATGNGAPTSAHWRSRRRRPGDRARRRMVRRRTVDFGATPARPGRDRHCRRRRRGGRDRGSSPRGGRFRLANEHSRRGQCICRRVTRVEARQSHRGSPPAPTERPCLAAGPEPVRDRPSSDAPRHRPRRARRHRVGQARTDSGAQDLRGSGRNARRARSGSTARRRRPHVCGAYVHVHRHRELDVAVERHRGRGMGRRSPTARPHRDHDCCRASRERS